MSTINYVLTTRSKSTYILRDRSRILQAPDWNLNVNNVDLGVEYLVDEGFLIRQKVPQNTIADLYKNEKLLKLGIATNDVIPANKITKIDQFVGKMVVAHRSSHGITTSPIKSYVQCE